MVHKKYKFERTASRRETVGQISRLGAVTTPTLPELETNPILQPEKTSTTEDMKRNSNRRWERIPHSFGAIKEECLDSESLEFVLLSAPRNRELYEKFEGHFLVCEHCLKKIRAFQKFYRILDHELCRPVSPRIVEMARTLVEPVE